MNKVPRMRSWVRDLLDSAEQGDVLCMVTVVNVRGSAPREQGARMLVGSTEVRGTIGGGQLEHQCIQAAARLIREGCQVSSYRSYPLGSNCGQCCGGVVDVLFEPGVDRDQDWLLALRARLEVGGSFLSVSRADGTRGLAADDPYMPGCQWDKSLNEFRQRISPPAHTVAVFGAGHVGSAVVAALAPLDCQIRWIDGRQGVFAARLPENVSAIAAIDPASEVAALPPQSFCLVMTHSHSLDFDITDAMLRRNDLAYCGLIGSLAKRRRFERLMRKQGVNDDCLQNLECPIGLPGIDGKRPQEIAIAVAAQMLQFWSSATASRNTDRKLHAL